MTLTQFQFNKLYKYYKDRQLKRYNKNPYTFPKDQTTDNYIARILSISPRTLSNYKNNNIPEKESLSVKKLSATYNTLIRQDKIKDDYIELKKEKKPILKKQIKKAEKEVKEIKKIRQKKIVVDYLVTVFSRCKDVSENDKEHYFSFYVDRLKSIEKLEKMANDRHSLFWGGHKLIEIEITSITETYSLEPFKTGDFKIIYQQ